MCYHFYYFFIIIIMCCHTFHNCSSKATINSRLTNNLIEFNGVSNVYKKKCFFCCNFTFLQVQSDMFLNITMLTVWFGLGTQTAFSG